MIESVSTPRTDAALDVASSKRAAVGEPLAGRGAGILVWDNDCLFNDVFWAVCTISIPFFGEIDAHTCCETLLKQSASHFDDRAGG